MACCVTIRPTFVSQAEGPYHASGGFFTFEVQNEWFWRPVGTEGEFSKQDYSVAFDDMTHPILVDYPAELKTECYKINSEDGPVVLTLRFEFPDSADCEGSADPYPLSSQILLHLDACGPVTLKAVCRGHVERWRSFTVIPDFFGFIDFAQPFDSVQVWGTRTGSEFITDQCTQSPGSFSVAGGCGIGDGDQCEMKDRVNCGVVQLCEGETSLWIQCGTGDANSHVGGYWEVELTFECGESSLDCDDEVEEEFYLPNECGFNPDDSPCDPATYPDGNCPPNPQPGSGRCFCDVCSVDFFTLTMRDMVRGLCDRQLIDGTINEEFWDNFNGLFTLTYKSALDQWTQELGTQFDLGDKGILLYAFVSTSGDYKNEFWVYRIEGVPSCFVDGDDLHWRLDAVRFWGECLHTPLAGGPGEWQSELDCFGPPTGILNHLCGTPLWSSGSGDLTDETIGCEGGSVTYEDPHPDVAAIDPDTLGCFCDDTDDPNSVTLTAHGVAFDCSEL